MALPSLRVRIQADTDQFEAGMDRAQTELRQFDGEARRAGATADRFAAQLARTRTRSSGFGRGIQNASFQVGDFATQVGAGTAASIALGQQLPQLLQGFGIFGAVLGAAAAVAIPLARAMGSMNDQGRDAVEVFGTLTPVFQAIGQGMAALQPLAIAMAEGLVNNIDRIITIAATAAAVFAGRWVAGVVAARVATLSFSASLVALRGALIRTGIGAIIVGLGEAVYQFTRLAQAAGGAGEAFNLLVDVGREAWERIRAGAALLVTRLGIHFNDIQYNWALMVGNLQIRWGQFLDYVAGSSIGEALGIGGGNAAAATAGMAGQMAAITDALDALLGQEAELLNTVNAPMESIERLREIMRSFKDERITLPDLFGSGAGSKDGEDGPGAKLEGEAKRVADAMQRIKDLTVGGLSDQLGAWGSYFGNLASVVGSGNERILQISKAFAAAQATIDAYSAAAQVLRDPTLPFFAKAAAAFQVLGTGLGFVNAIRSASDNGSTGGGAAAATPQATEPQRVDRFVTVQLSGGDQIGQASIRNLIEQINDAIGDGAQLNVRA